MRNVVETAVERTQLLLAGNLITALHLDGEVHVHIQNSRTDTGTQSLLIE